MTHFAWRAAARRFVAPACASFAALAILTACGGGGGGSAPPAATLSITSSSTATTSAGTPVTLHAAHANATGATTWSLSGPGTLSATTGDDVTYTPPDGESLAQAATATVTASLGGLTSNVVISVAVGTVAGQHWDTGLTFKASWNSLAYAGGTFVAVGSNGAIDTSTDGQHWATQFTTPTGWSSVTHGDAGWVAVSYDGHVASSTDGTTWSVHTGTLPDMKVQSLVMQVVAGNGVYLAGGFGPSSWISSDGVTWTLTGHGFSTLAFGGGTFVGVDGTLTYTSTDGRTWNLDTQSPFPAETIAYANGQFLARSGGEFQGSADGRTWTTLGTTPYSNDPVFSTGDAFYQSGSSNYSFNGTLYGLGAIGTSTVGQPWMWTYRNQSAVGIATGIAKSANALVVVSRDGSIGSGADVDHLGAVVTASAGFLLSADYAQGKYLALAYEGNLLSSADGHAWSTTPLGTADWPDSPQSFSGYAVSHTATGRIVVAGVLPDDSGNGPRSAILYSDDGATWQQSTPPTTSGASALVNDGSRLVLFAGGSAYASTDGNTWTLLGTVPIGNTQWINRATYIHGTYIIVGGGGLAATSTDAVHWTIAPALMPADGTLVPVTLYGATWANGRFVAVGDSGDVATSTDGQAWHVATSATPQVLFGVAASPQGELVAVGDQGAAETSADGVHWTLRTSPTPSSLRNVVFVNGLFLAVGDRSAIALSSH